MVEVNKLNDRHGGLMLWKTKKDIRIKQLESKVDLHEKLRSVWAQEKFVLESELKKLKAKPVEKDVKSNIDLSSPLFQRIIKAGRNALIKKAHPDHGGSREQLEEIEKAFEILKTVELSYESQQDIAARYQREAIYRGMAAQQNMNNGWWR